MIILNGKTNEHLDMLDGGVIQRLLEEKWKTFARKEFLKRLVLMFLHLIALSIAVSLRSSSDGNLLGPSDLRSICRYFAELVTCLGCIGFVVFQQGEEIMSQGLLGFLINLSSNPAKAIFLIANILILCCVPCRLMGYRHTEDVLLTFAIPGSWFFLIFFAGAVKLTGPFVTMIYNMLVGDIVRFSIIYLIFLLGFTQAFFFLFKNQTGESQRFKTYSQTWMALFHMTLGYYEYSEFSDTFYSALTWFVFAVFMVIMPILMLNMLIAMMGNTYCEVITQSEREFVKQWAKIVVALERAVSQKKAKEYMQSYSIRLASPSGDDDPEKEQRAVMVIKSKSKSKAKQRKGALSNWKRFGKIVIQELRQCGGTAEQFRQKYRINHHFSTSACKPSPVDKSDDSDSERGAAIDSGNGLGVALNQLAFAHDLDFSKSSVTPQSASPSDKESATPTGGKSFGDLFQQLAWAHDLEVGRPQTPTGSHRDSVSSQSRPTSPSPEQNTYPSLYKILQFLK
ncbi:transient receptor potential cation channel subfamily V member 6-like [Limulus polyphemus]|uniref:Transient receptor potential cation channel subfamily V member 6-like n=1 Tax=Limulus polyphemus TaxID=6850 RepID=A0ABM1SE57_LIMPO|nr:transient receptor potential cation channel subfamily V member 6-like [Limulus polyphemus]